MPIEVYLRRPPLLSADFWFLSHKASRFVNQSYGCENWGFGVRPDPVDGWNIGLKLEDLFRSPILFPARS